MTIHISEQQLLLRYSLSIHLLGVEVGGQALLSNVATQIHIRLLPDMNTII